MENLLEESKIPIVRKATKYLISSLMYSYIINILVDDELDREVKTKFSELKVVTALIDEKEPMNETEIKHITGLATSDMEEIETSLDEDRCKKLWYLVGYHHGYVRHCIPYWIIWDKPVDIMRKLAIKKGYGRSFEAGFIVSETYRSDYVKASMGLNIGGDKEGEMK